MESNFVLWRSVLAPAGMNRVGTMLIVHICHMLSASIM